MINIKLMSSNLNGINAAFLRGFGEVIKKTQPNLVCIQEVKANEARLRDNVRNMPGYESKFYTPEKGKKSGVAIYSKIHPKLELWGLGLEEGMEGRTIQMDFDKFTLINTYAPSGRNKKDLKHKHKYLKNIFNYVTNLYNENRKVILCGDFNVAYSELEVFNPNYYGPGFLNEEKILFKKFLKKGFIDTYRFFHPKTRYYTWRSSRLREYNLEGGFKLDYIFVSENLKDSLNNAYIKDYGLSDHDQLFLELTI